MAPTDFVVPALDARDADDWRHEHPELADSARIVVANGRGWGALRGIVPSSLSLGRAASSNANIGGTDVPRSIRLALELAARRQVAA